MATYTEALKEAFASAPVSEMIHHCLEINHPSFTSPIRIVQGNDDVKAKLEADAPSQAGRVVDFVAAPWDLVLPALEEDRMPELQLNFSNVSREMTRHIAAATIAGDPIRVLYRVYTDSTLLFGPQIDPPIELWINEATADNYAVKTTATLEDVFNSLFPRDNYVPERFPSLSNAT